MVNEDSEKEGNGVQGESDLSSCISAVGCEELEMDTLINTDKCSFMLLPTEPMKTAIMEPVSGLRYHPLSDR